jgi:hypothetical protein
MSRQVVSQRWNISASISTAVCGFGGVAPKVRKSETFRSRLAGCQTRLTPMPMTMASPVRSNKIPHNLLPPDDKRSFGHLIWSPTYGAICLTKSCAASTATKASVDGAASVVRKRTIVLANRLPTGLSQLRPRRPRPPSWASARSHSPSGAPSAARWSRSAFVEPVSATSSKMGVRIAPLPPAP